MAVVVVAHGELATALLRAAKMIAGESPRAYAVDLAAEESPEAFHRRLVAALEAGLEAGSGQWLVLTDLLGGTPHRVATTVRDELPNPRACAVVSGANLAMVVEALLSCDGETDAYRLARHVASTGLQQVRGSVPAM